jgi:hypothetical protein
MSSITYEEAFNKVLEQLSDVQAFQVNDLKQLTKKISQLIAKSWLPGGEDIKNTFLYGKEEEIKELLKQYGVNLPAPASTSLSIDWNSFFGSAKEEKNGGQTVLKWTIAYPPRPYYDVTDEQLQAWVDNDDPNTSYPTAAYIPLTF